MWVKFSFSPLEHAVDLYCKELRQQHSTFAKRKWRNPQFS